MTRCSGRSAQCSADAVTPAITTATGHDRVKLTVVPRMNQLNYVSPDHVHLVTTMQTITELLSHQSLYNYSYCVHAYSKNYSSLQSINQILSCSHVAR